MDGSLVHRRVHDQAFRKERDGILWLNPGSCGKRRFDQEITFCVMTAQDGAYQTEKVTVPHPPR